MRIIKVNATESTNAMLKDLLAQNPAIGSTCLVTNHQIKGRGQMGTTWNSNPGQNLTFSIGYSNIKLQLDQQFLLSIVTGLGVLDVLKNKGIKNCSLKWPNDIMAANYKIGGILIENLISNSNISASIIGVGININQTEFENLPQASSLKLNTGNNYDLEELLNQCISEIDLRVKTLLDTSSHELIYSEYEENLFRKNKASTFLLPDNSYLTGIILGVTKSGLLKLKLEDDKIEHFNLKEIKLLF